MKCHHVKGKVLVSQHQAGYMFRMLYIKYQEQSQSWKNLSNNPISDGTFAFKSDGKSLIEK